MQSFSMKLPVINNFKYWYENPWIHMKILDIRVLDMLNMSIFIINFNLLHLYIYIYINT